ncbi:MAG TPA: protein kinase [Micromonosporaceae bacterium]|nr:protein kinase [Micromonosporaceae bacterium]
MTTQTSTWHEPPVPSNQRAVPGTTIGGRYQLRAAIGNGGMGTVWQAVDTVLRRDVAVKEVLLPPGMPPAERTAMYERTFREGRAAAALSHPSVVQVYDVVTENGRPWIVMELLQARSLSEMIISDGPLAGRAVAKIGIALLGALEVAHAAGVLHRDVKPANVLICVDGRCVLTDFGVARMPSGASLTQPGMVLGSPHFISPERAIGASFGPPSDLFSLGVTLYTAAEGRPPFDRGDPFETMRAIVEEAPAPTQRAGVLTPVLMGLLEKDPEHRWTVAEARKALRDLTNGALTNRAGAQGVDQPAAPTSGTARAPMAVAPPSHAAPDAPASRVGGGALLGPGESVEDRWSTPSAQRPAGADPAAVDAVGVPSTGSGVGGVRSAIRGNTTEQPILTRGQPFRDHEPGLVTARRAAGRAWHGVRSWPRAVRFGAAGAVVVIVAAVLSTTFGLIGGGRNHTGAPPSATSSTAAPFPTRSFDNGRGIVVSVPASWRESKPKNGSYVDFLDPTNSGQKIRVNVEASGNDPKQFLGVAERGLERGTTCKDYQRISLTDITLDGHAAAQLEYTCGTGDTERHGLWAAATIDGKAYEFYLTVPETDFAASRQIYEVLVSSVKLTPVG